MKTNELNPASRREFLSALALGGAALAAGCGSGGKVSGGGGVATPFWVYGLGNARVSRMNNLGTVAATLDNGHAALFEAGRWRDLGFPGRFLGLSPIFTAP